MATSEDRRTGGKDEETVTVGVVADPVAAPAKVARQLARDLPPILAEQVDRERTWQVEVVREQLPPSDHSHTLMMEAAGERMRNHGWDLVVCVTDLPLRSGKQPIVGDMSSEHRAVVISLPAFGGMALRRRVRSVVSQLIADMHRRGTPSDTTEEHRRRRLPGLSRRFRRVTPDHPAIDVRVLASRGGTRLLIGMVRDNHPWRLVFSLTGPLVGALAFSAFYLINTTAWELAAAMGVLRLSAVAVGSVAVMVVWLLVYHRLWEPMGRRPDVERKQAVLFNASTVLTLAIGVGCMYIALYLANLAASVVVLVPEVLGDYVGAGPGPSDYASIVVLVTAAATIAGAIGSGFESQDAVREAAFSYRERERREILQRRQEQREQRQEYVADGETENP